MSNSYKTKTEQNFENFLAAMIAIFIGIAVILAEAAVGIELINSTETITQAGWLGFGALGAFVIAVDFFLTWALFFAD